MNKPIYTFFLSFLLLCFESAVAKDTDLHKLEKSKPSKILLDYFKSYFGSDEYSVFADKVDLGDEKLIVAVHLVSVEKQIFNKGLGIVVVGGKVIPYIYFEKRKIYNGDRKAIIDVTAFHYPYFGWRVYYSNRKFYPPYRAGFSIDYCESPRGGGADSILVDWDSTKKQFVEAHPDWN